MCTRRIVTGTAANGKSVLVSDEEVEAFSPALMPGMGFVQLWGADTAVTLPTDGAAPDATTYFPPVGGFRFAVVTIPPESTTPAAGDLDVGHALAEVEEHLPGLMAHMEPDHPGMHTTDTVDFDVVLSGELWLELDDGAEVRLTAGDCVIQNGTRHAWHNRSSEPCILAVAIVGARRGG